MKWTIIAGIVDDSLIISVRNLGYTKNAGEFVRRFFADIGSAGGHRAMAKAVVPMRAFREKFGDLDGRRDRRRAARARRAVPARGAGQEAVKTGQGENREADKKRERSGSLSAQPSA